MKRFALALVALLAVGTSLMGAAPIQLMGAGKPSATATATPNVSIVETVGKAVNTGGSAAATWSVSPPQNQLMAACAIGQFGDPITPPAGWTSLYSSTANYGTGCFWALAGASEPTTETFTTTGANLTVTMTRYLYAATSAPQFSENLVNGTAASTTSITPATVGALPVAVFCGAQAPSSFSTPSSYTQSGVPIGFPTPPSTATNYLCNTYSAALTVNTTTGQTASSTSGATADDYGYQFVISHS